MAEDLPGPGSVLRPADWSSPAPVRPGDVITAHAEVLEVRADKPVHRLRTWVTRDDGVVTPDGEAVVRRGPLPRGG